MFRRHFQRSHSRLGGLYCGGERPNAASALPDVALWLAPRGRRGTRRTTVRSVGSTPNT
jgi:hypothetical protein